jgi:hypothetical protein
MELAMIRAETANIIPSPLPATDAEIIDIETGEVLTVAEAHRRAMLRRVWAETAMDGSAL